MPIMCQVLLEACLWLPSFGRPPSYLMMVGAGLTWTCKMEGLIRSVRDEPFGAFGGATFENGRVINSEYFLSLAIKGIYADSRLRWSPKRTFP